MLGLHLPCKPCLLNQTCRLALNEGKDIVHIHKQRANPKGFTEPWWATIHGWWDAFGLTTPVLRPNLYSSPIVQSLPWNLQSLCKTLKVILNYFMVKFPLLAKAVVLSRAACSLRKPRWWLRAMCSVWHQILIPSVGAPQWEAAAIAKVRGREWGLIARVAKGTSWCQPVQDHPCALSVGSFPNKGSCPAPDKASMVEFH